MNVLVPSTRLTPTENVPSPILLLLSIVCVEVPTVCVTCSNCRVSSLIVPVSVPIRLFVAAGNPASVTTGAVVSTNPWASRSWLANGLYGCCAEALTVLKPSLSANVVLKDRNRRVLVPLTWSVTSIGVVGIVMDLMPEPDTSMSSTYQPSPPLANSSTLSKRNLILTRSPANWPRDSSICARFGLANSGCSSMNLKPGPASPGGGKPWEPPGPTTWIIVCHGPSTSLPCRSVSMVAIWTSFRSTSAWNSGLNPAVNLRRVSPLTGTGSAVTRLPLVGLPVSKLAPPGIEYRHAQLAELNRLFGLPFGFPSEQAMCHRAEPPSVPMLHRSPDDGSTGSSRNLVNGSVMPTSTSLTDGSLIRPAMTVLGVVRMKSLTGLSSTICRLLLRTIE